MKHRISPNSFVVIKSAHFVDPFIENICAQLHSLLSEEELIEFEDVQSLLNMYVHGIYSLILAEWHTDQKVFD